MKSEKTLICPPPLAFRSLMRNPEQVLIKNNYDVINFYERICPVLRFIRIRATRTGKFLGVGELRGCSGAVFIRGDQWPPCIRRLSFRLPAMEMNAFAAMLFAD
jgi:hypothetical protein